MINKIARLNKMVKMFSHGWVVNITVQKNEKRI